MVDPGQERIWTVAEAKARLSEVLRRAEEEGPQRIGTRKPFFVVSESAWLSHVRPRESLGRWLVEHVPRGAGLEIPEQPAPVGGSPFVEEDAG